MSTHEIVEVLGGSLVIGGVDDPVTMVQAVRRGLPWGAFESLGSALAMSQGELAAMLHIPPRTLSRRKGAGRLEAMESDRLFRLARVFVHTVDVFGSLVGARRWLDSENRALGGRRPMDLLDTDAGVREVDDALGRIEHGLFG